jgi:hypothetical protein
VIQTSEVYVEPSAVTVGLRDDVLTLCHEVLPVAGLRVYRVAHVAAACERIAVLLPQLVVVPAMLHLTDLEMIEDRAVAVGAVLLHLDATHGYDVLARELEVAVAEVRERFGRRRRA